ncbi:MAG: hypothetical protein C4582_03975 [Desulfobacteraceae bacterium]|jgi:galactose-1-phosphate uridylyltransferase|nr:MAG: hypothetical protein C4582_03975 [Desulfobacteraceae bacterium]
MAKIQFPKKEEQSCYLDPREGFSNKSMPFEVRRDCLTGHVSRILSFRRKYPEVTISPELLEASRKICPFCPERIASSTPDFPPDIIPEGKMKRGSAWLFPNAFPYARYSGVIVLSQEHFLYPDQFTVDVLKDGFVLAQEGIKRITLSRPEFQYSYINWNYLPSAGAGLYHPHLQIIVEDTPTFSHQKVLEGLGRYSNDGDFSFWEEYIVEEIKIGERYIGRQGEVHFISAFSPRGVFGEIIFLFSNRRSVDEITEEDWMYFSKGLVKVLGYLKGHTPSFNLSLFSGGLRGSGSRVYGSLCPRMLIPPWNISDINYFEKLHGEVVCVVSPEELAGSLRTSFAQAPDHSVQ